MKKPLKATALLLSIAVIAACGPSYESEITLADVAQAAARQDDRASVEDLASWLVEGREDFKLIDVRLPADFESGSIGDAENIPIAKIINPDVLQGLPTNRMVLVYSNGSENAAKAAVILRLSGIDAHLLAGGYNAWQERILNPDISAEELDGESLQVTQQRAYSCYFVGDRGEGAAQRSEAKQPFVPPVFELDEEEDLAPLPPPGEESC